MRVIVLRHHDEDDPGLVGADLEARGAEVVVHPVVDHGTFPDPEGFDLGIVLGSKWSVYDRPNVSGWIDGELDWLRRADRYGVLILGICFGAQALSAALGGSVEPAPKPEIGWTMIEPTDPVIPPGPWFQFHGDRCVPPPDAAVLAINGIGVQAFSVRRNLAVQFHPEIDRLQLERWIDDGGEEAMRSAGVDVEAVLVETDRRVPAARQRVHHLVSYCLELANQGATH